MLNASEIRVIGNTLWMEKSMLTKCGPVTQFLQTLNGARFRQPSVPVGYFGAVTPAGSVAAGLHAYAAGNELANEVGKYGSAKQFWLIQFGCPPVLPAVLTALHPGS